MARIVSKANGAKLIQYELDGKRSVWLGKDVTAKAAQKWLDVVEALVKAKTLNVAPDQKIVEWAAELPDKAYSRLADNGLLPERIAPAPAEQVRTTLGAMMQAYIDRRTDLKAWSVKNLTNARAAAVAFWGEDKSLRSFTRADGADFRRYLLSRFKTATVSAYVKKTRQIFADAVDRELLAFNPLAKVKAGRQDNPDRLRFIDRATIDKIISNVADLEWKVMIALARYAGLRVPSEPLALKWGDIDFDANRMTVHSPKTEHHEGRGVRIVPLFPEIRHHLLALFEQQAADGSVYVINRYRDAKQNLRTQFERFITDAGCKPWPKLWQNLRSSRATELVETFPGHVVSAWLGHSEKIADKHYRQVTDEHFAKASKEVATGVANLDGTTRNEAEPVQPMLQPSLENRDFPKKHAENSTPGGNRTHNEPRKNQAETSVGATGGTRIARPACRPRRNHRRMGQARTRDSVRTARRCACQLAHSVSPLLTRESAAGERAKRCDPRPAADQHAAERSEAGPGVRHAARLEEPIRSRC